MKLHRCYILLTLWLILSYEVSAQDYQISTDKKTITVSSDCSIPVEEFAPSDIDIYGNGNKGGVNRSGTDLFSQKTLELNNYPKGILFKRDQSAFATVEIKFDEINEETDLKFYQAVFTSQNGWSPDINHTFQITIKKSIVHGAEGEDFTGSNRNTFEIKDIQNILEKLTYDVDSLKRNNNIRLIITLLLIGLSIGLFLFKKNRKALNDLSKDYSELKKAVDNWDKNSIQTASAPGTPQKNKGKNTMSDDDIKRFIVEQIKRLQPQNVSSTIQPTVITNPNTSPTQKEEQMHDTDNVKYHQNDNSFSLEQTDIKIFRMYSRKGEYYYTIVDDTAVREELIGMLQMFEGCITYQTTDGVAKKVEPVTDGKLRKDGNKFYVDPNNKLVVKFA